MPSSIIPAATLVPAPWRNGLGTSREIARGPGWSISLAELERDSPFSDYPGMDRVFTPIAGTVPPALAFSGGPFEACPLLVPKPFPGDVPTLARIGAPGRAFNVIVQRGAWRARVVVRAVAAGERIGVPPAAVSALYCIEGGLALGPETIGPGDSLVSLDEPAPELAATAPGRVVLVALDPV